uniref:Ig-like domain-containing protein n=1 Tax=Astyanax mexicanus TaxID=7994 RepID=A0A3B1J3V2_ASTMX
SLSLSLALSLANSLFKASEVDLQVQTVKIGENVTLKCEQSSFRDSQKALSWYKQSFGKLPQFILRAAENNQDPRFARSFKERFKMISNEEQMNLKIINTVEEDAGTYFCVKVKDQVVEFGSGTLLLFSGNNSTVYETGESVTLQCSVLMATLSCSEDHSVYWFKHDSGEPRPGIIFTHGDSSSPCTRSSETVSPTQSCIYKLPKNTLSLSDAGTYYCAVAACGEILYGTGTKLHVKDNNFWIVAALLTFSMISVIVIVVLAVLLLKKHQKDTDAVNYAALNFKKKPASSRTPRVKQTQTVQSNKDIYSQVKVR